MKIGVISDTHIPERATEIPPKALEGLKGSDLIIHAGDISRLQVLEELKKVCANVKAVWGNMDPEDIKNGFPRKEIITAGSHKIGVMHGWGHPGSLLRVLSEEFRGEDVDTVIFGHSHQPFNEYHNGILYFNPGSPTDKIFSPYTSYGILEINDKIEGRIVRL
ncbi:MAG: metallophosphoesterase [Candidatus Omnitrophota bacterium]